MIVNRLGRRLRNLPAALWRRRRRLAAEGLALALLVLTVLYWPMDTGHFLDTAASGQILDRTGEPLYAFLGEGQQWCFKTPLEAIGPRLVQATLAAEDRRFWSHPGVDPLAAARAAWQLVSRRRVASGASTLTMQVIKLAGHPSHTVGGKLWQILQALRLERHASKERILEAYLNHAPYGLNLAGCEAAARRYFGKPARELTLPEAALLAALPKSPTGLMPLAEDPRGALSRRNEVLARMRRAGFISEPERARAAAAALGAQWHPFPSLAPHVAQRLASPARTLGVLTTTLDRATQQLAETAVAEHARAFAGEVDGAALIVMDVETATALAWVGSAGFWAEGPASQYDGARAVRSPGSTLKPFIYALALERNCLYPSEVLLDDTLDLGTYNPRNFDKRYHGLVEAGAALRRSLNVPAVMVLRRTGGAAACDYLRRIGLTTLARPASAYGLGLALGDCEARLDELCAAYGMLAGLGQWRPLGVLARTPPPTPRRLLSRGTALALFGMLEGPLPGEPAPADGAVRSAPRVCWKTGTSTGNHDAWAFVFNRHYVVGAWLGNSDGRPSARLVGAQAALPLAAGVFRRLPPRAGADWPEPGDDMRPVTVCALSGLPASAWCEHTRQVMLPKGMYLNRVCDVHWPLRRAGEGERTSVAERWPASAVEWDLARIAAPVVADLPRQDWMDAPVPALQILNPPDRARFILTGEPGGDRIRLRSSGDPQGQVFWYLNGRFLGAGTPEQPVLLDLEAGHSRLVCMTPQGLMAQSNFQVVTPGESPPDIRETR